MINGFLCWLSEQRTRARMVRSRNWRRAIQTELELLERRLVLTSLAHLYQSPHQVQTSEYNSDDRPFTVYEDLTGDGLTPDDVPLPITLAISRLEQTLQEGEVELPPNGYFEHDNYTETTTNFTIANGGKLHFVDKKTWDDLVPDGVLQRTPGNSPYEVAGPGTGTWQ